MTETPVATIPVAPEIVDKALARLRTLVRGNGMDPAAVTLASFDGTVVDFETLVVLHIVPRKTDKTMPGRVPGNVLPSQGAVQERLQQVAANAARHPIVRQQLIAALQARPDRGFGADGFEMALEHGQETLIVHEACATCQGQGAAACGVCGGKGRSVCPKCRGTRQMTCPTCHGQQYMPGPNGARDRTQCIRCQGRGKVSCTNCQNQGSITCRACRGKGRSICKTCAGSGARSVVTEVSLTAKGRFLYDRAAMPTTLPPTLDQWGGSLVTGKHAKLEVITDAARITALIQQGAADEVPVAYRTRLPWGIIRFNMGDGHEAVEGGMMGYQGMLVRMPPFLEKLVAPALAQLAQAGTPEALHTAAGTRLVADALLAVARWPRKKALATLRGRYNFGIRGDTLQQVIGDAHKALRRVTQRMRLAGLAAGIVVSGALDGFYYFVRGHAAWPYGLDGALPVIGAALTTLAMQLAERHALHKALGKLLPQDAKERRKLMPRIGGDVALAAGGIILLWLLFGAIAVKTGGVAPLWWRYIAPLLHLS